MGLRTTSDGKIGGKAAHLDAGVIMALAMPGDMHHAGAKRMCGAAVRCGYVLVVSPISIMEAAAAAARKRTIILHKIQSGSEAELAGAEAHGEANVGLVLKTVDRMADLGHMKIADLKGWSPDFLCLCLMMIDCRGSAVRRAKSRTYWHRGIGPHDLLHCAAAKHLDAPIIITTDAALADIAGRENGCGHIRIQITSGPLIDLLGGGGVGVGQDGEAAEVRSLGEEEGRFD